MASVAFDHVFKRFGDVVAVNDMNIEIEDKDNAFVGRVDPRTSIKAGNEVQVAFNMDNMQLFETDGEQTTIM